MRLPHVSTYTDMLFFSKCVKAANLVCRHTDIFRQPFTVLKQILQQVTKTEEKFYICFVLDTEIILEGAASELTFCYCFIYVLILYKCICVFIYMCWFCNWPCTVKPAC